MTLDQNITEELKAKLEEEREKLKKELEKIARPAGGEDEYQAIYEDIGDEKDENATEVQMYANRLALKEDLEKQLKDVEDALHKMEKGVYGICEECGQEIEIERLRIYPMARLCIKCAQKKENSWGNKI